MEGLNTIRVNKIANPDLRKKSEDSRSLPKMPRLYMELIENKDKIRQSVVNKEYDPDDTASDITFFDRNKKDNPSRNPLSDVFEKDEDDGDEEEEEEDEDDGDDDDGDDDEEEEEDEEVNKMIKKEEENEEEEDEENDEDDDLNIKNENKKTFEEEDDDDDDEEEDDDEDEDEEEDDDEEEEEEEEDIEGRIGTIAPSPSKPSKMSKSQKYANILNEDLPPRLSELEQKGEVHTKKTIPNLDRIYQTEDEEDELKRELLFKFELLKKSYKMNDIPDFNIHSDLKQMSRSYESTLRRVSLDSCVENYKQLLIGGFMVLEFILGYLFKFDMQGFTQQQILNMNQYERLLIELGENSYVPGGSQWPVEVRLLLMVMGNAAVFIIAKMIMKKTGSNLMGMMNSFVNPSPSSSSSSGGGTGGGAKRKMRGPNINPDDIPDISQ